MTALVTVPEWLYRIVHINNLQHILVSGICSAEHKDATPDYVSIGNPAIINRRREIIIPLEGYGRLTDYIPFYFAGHSPTLYNIITGYGGVTQTPQSDLVIVRCSLHEIMANCSCWCFTDGPAMLSTTAFYNSRTDFNKLDWEAIKSRYWANSEQDPARKTKKQAEFLVKSHVPAQYIKGIGTSNPGTESRVNELLQQNGHPARCGTDTGFRFFYPDIP